MKKKKDMKPTWRRLQRAHRARKHKLRLAQLPQLFVASDFTKLSALAENIIALKRVAEQNEPDPLLEAWTDNLLNQFQELVRRCIASVMGGKGQS
jgi:hypothetical protein